MKLPPATVILAALEAAGRPRSLATVRSWTSGKIGLPFDALLVLDWRRGWGLRPWIDTVSGLWKDSDELLEVPFGAFLALAKRRRWNLAPELEEFARRFRAHPWRKRGAP